MAGGELRLLTTDAGRDPAYPFESGAVSGLGREALGYGYYEVRARLPKGQGVWPAFWLIDYGCSHEIDAFELLGDEPDRVYMTYHHAGKQVYQASFKGPDFSAGYHVFGVDWQPGSVTWYVDGIQRARYAGTVSGNPLVPCLNTAVGGDWPGSPDATTPFPQSYAIDYLRAYDRAPLTWRAARLTGDGSVYGRRYRTAYLRGTLRDAVTGRTLAGRTVTLYRRSGTSWLRVGSARTSATGIYSFRQYWRTRGTRYYRVRSSADAANQVRYAAAAKAYTLRVR